MKDQKIQNENKILRRRYHKAAIMSELRFYNNNKIYTSCLLNYNFSPIGSILLNNYYTIDKYQRYLAPGASWQNHFDNGTKNKWIPKLKQEHNDVSGLEAHRLVGFYVVYPKGKSSNPVYGVVDGHNRLESISLRLSVWIVKAKWLINKVKNNNIYNSNVVEKTLARIESGKRMLKRKGRYVVKLPDKNDDDKQSRLKACYYKIIDGDYFELDKNNQAIICKRSSRGQVRNLFKLRNELIGELDFKAKYRLISSLNAIRFNIHALCKSKQNIKDKFNILNQYFDVNTKVSGMRPFVAKDDDTTNNRQAAINWYNINNGDSCPSNIQAKVRALLIQLAPNMSIGDKYASTWMKFVDILNDNTKIIKQVLMNYYYASGRNKLKRSEIDNYTSTLLRSHKNNIPKFLNDILPLGKVYYFIASLEKGHLVHNPFYDDDLSESDKNLINEQLKEVAERLRLFAGTTIIPICFGLYHNQCDSQQLLRVLKNALYCEERYRIGFGGARTHYGDASDSGTFGPNHRWTTVRQAWMTRTQSNSLVRMVCETMLQENYEDYESFKSGVKAYHATLSSKSARRITCTLINDADSHYYQMYLWKHHKRYHSTVLEHHIYHSLKNKTKVRCIKLDPKGSLRLQNMALIYVSSNTFSKFRKCAHQYEDTDYKKGRKLDKEYYDKLLKVLGTLSINNPLINLIRAYQKRHRSNAWIMKKVLRKRLIEVFDTSFNNYTCNHSSFFHMLPKKMTKECGPAITPQSYNHFIVMCLNNYQSIEKMKKEIKSLSPNEFELITTYALLELRYQNVKHTEWSDDDGVDVIATKNNKKFVFQCKHNKKQSGIKSIRDIGEWSIINKKKSFNAVVVIANDNPKGSLKEANDDNSIQLWTLTNFAKKLISIVNRWLSKRETF